jgi:hypothetical protein
MVWKSLLKFTKNLFWERCISYYFMNYSTIDTILLKSTHQAVLIVGIVDMEPNTIGAALWRRYKSRN